MCFHSVEEKIALQFSSTNGCVYTHPSVSQKIIHFFANLMQLKMPHIFNSIYFASVTIHALQLGIAKLKFLRKFSLTDYLLTTIIHYFLTVLLLYLFHCKVAFLFLPLCVLFCHHYHLFLTIALVHLVSIY